MASIKGKFKYARIDSNGVVLGFVYFRQRLVEVDALLPGGRYVYQDGQVVPAPDIKLSLPDVASIGAPVVPDMVVPEFVDPCPDRLQLLVGNRSFGYTPGDDIKFGTLGVYKVRVIGPSPWESNAVNITIVAPDGEV